MDDAADRYDDSETLPQWNDGDDASVVAKTFLPDVLDRIRRGSGIDFSGYKTGTLWRRLQKRMQARGCENVADYLALFDDPRLAPEEVDSICRELLINVTGFFRDPEVFAQLAETVLPDILRGRDAADDLRIWSAGCASGEEAYSLAMLALDVAGRLGFDGNVRVFATDLHAGVLADASRGRYRDEAVENVPEALLRRYFQRVDGGWQVDAALRRHVVFARHNLLADPPFTRIDLALCRNLLIYLAPPMQLRVLAQLHFALKPQGLLLLGSSETVGACEEDAFSVVDCSHRLYRRCAAQLQRGGDVTGSGAVVVPRASVAEPPAIERESLQAELQATRERLQEMLLELQCSHERIDLANEELTASNEELQSTNEELKSANEDLNALNLQLEAKNDALTALNRDYDHLLASAEIGTVFLDAELRLRRFSPGVESFLSLRAQDIGRPLGEIVYFAGGQEEFVASLRRVVADGERSEREIELPGGRWYLERLSPFRGDDGRRDGVVLTWTEITEVKRIRDLAEALAEERTRLQGILDAMPDGVYIANAEHDIEYLNPVIEREFGPVEGRKCYAYFHGRDSQCDWCKNPDVFAGKSVHWEWTSSKGRTYSLFDMPFRNPDGSTSKFEIFHDITPIDDARWRLLEAAELAQVGHWEWLVRHGELRWSDETFRCFGYEPGAVVPSYELFLQHVHEDDRSRVEEAVAGALARGDHYLAEFRFRRADGAVRFGRANGHVKRDGDGEPLTLSGAMQDITAMRESEDWLQAAFRACPFAASIARAADGIFVYANDNFETQFGWRPAEMVGHTSIEIGLWPDEQTRSAWVEELGRKGTLTDFESLWHDRGGNTRHVSISAETLQLDGVPHILAFIQDITERKESEKKIEFLAHHDPLTGLPNRVLFRDRFLLATAWAERDAGRVALLFVDLDHFKTINDTLGHPVGDQLLQEAARRLRACVRDTDTISRLGGDEFLIAMTDIADADDVNRVAGKIVDLFAEPMSIDGHELSATLSIGIALWPDDGTDFDILLQRADTAMYQAKGAGRNTYRFFTPEMNAEAMENLKLRAALRRALENGEFVLHYQPQIELASRRVIGVEALLRWRRDDGELISPARFIPVAEDSGLIVPIGEWVVGEACRQLARWQEQGFGDLVVAVNLSAAQFHRGDLEGCVIRALAQSGIDPASLELELTESLLLDDAENVMAVAHRFKSLGVRMSIDDFGTGYSSLAYLKRFDVDKLKIDQSFVRDIATDPDDAAIVRAIISMARSLKLKVIAEGVESEEIARFLGIYHCDEAQGYHFARPMPAEALSGWLADWRAARGDGL